MKLKITFLIVLSLNFINCKQEVKVEAKSKDTAISSTKQEKAPHLNNNWVAEMALNNGAKWEANLETTSGVANMAKLIAERKTISLGDYRNLGDSLNDVKNTLVKECTMTGASHDNLHIFLHPLIQKIELLQKTGSAETGAQIKESIAGHLNAYYIYFE